MKRIAIEDQRKAKEFMKLAMSNIAWAAEQDQAAFQILRENMFVGLEIAPTRVFPSHPYDCLKEARQWSQTLYEEEGLVIPSMQSIWYGRTEKIFGSKPERERLSGYTKKAIRFAEQIGCRNLVFGCPRNRTIPENGDSETAVPFFQELAGYAKEHHTVIAMEANPPIYHTNYINTTMGAIELIEKVHSEAFRLNLDFGTMVENRELVGILKGKVSFISHVHISEPGLGVVKAHREHLELSKRLQEEGYEGFVSVEMSRQEGLEEIRQVCAYIREVFG